MWTSCRPPTISPSKWKWPSLRNYKTVSLCSGTLVTSSVCLNGLKLTSTNLCLLPSTVPQKGSVTLVENHGPAVRDWTSLHASSAVRRARDDRASAPAPGLERTWPAAPTRATLRQRPTVSYAAQPATVITAQAAVVEYTFSARAWTTLHLHLRCMPHQLPRWNASLQRQRSVTPRPPFSVQISPAAMVSCARASALPVFAGPAPVMKFVAPAPNGKLRCATD